MEKQVKKSHATKKYPLIVVFFLLAISGCIQQPQPTGWDETCIDVATGPVQLGFDESPPEPTVIDTGDGTFTLTPKARYTAPVVIAAKKRYRWGWQSSLSPLDAVFTWGRLPDPDVRDRLTYSQSGRRYYYRFDGTCPVSKRYITEHSANTHLIPANDNVAGALDRLPTDEPVLLEGLLVNADGRQGDRRYWWHTSLTRSDAWEGSCELYYVTSVRIGNEVFA